MKERKKEREREREGERERKGCKRVKKGWVVYLWDKTGELGRGGMTNKQTRKQESEGGFATLQTKETKVREVWE